MAKKKSDLEFASSAVASLLKGVEDAADPGQIAPSESEHQLVELLAKRLQSIATATAEADNASMTDVTRPELDAKLEAIEARMDARVASIEGKIDTMLARMEGRDAAYEQRFASLDQRFTSIDQRFSNIDESLKDTRAAISNLKTTTIVTAVSAVLAIVLGVAAFNATVLSNMVASFESGKNTAASLERTAQEMKALQDRLEKGAKPQ